jgi:pantothenate kinase type III
LASGVLSGIFSEIVGYTHRIEKQFGSVQLIISGGDHVYFDNLPIKEKFAAPWLVLEGINYIAHLNE